MNRRKLLIALGASVGCAGCISDSATNESPNSPPERTPQSCEDSQSYLSVRRISIPDGQREHIIPVEHQSLKEPSHSVFETAINGTEVTACSNQSTSESPESSLKEGLELVQERLDQQRSAYNDTPTTPQWVQQTAYLRRDDELYAIIAGYPHHQISYNYESPEQCQVSKSYLSVQQVSYTEDQQERILPIEFDSLKGTVREVFEAAVRGESVKACPEKTVARSLESGLQEALNLVQQTLDRQQSEFDDTSAMPQWVQRTAYLRRDDELYAISGGFSDDSVSLIYTPSN